MTTRGGRRAAVAATLLVLLVAAAITIDPLREGMTARHFSDANWSPPVVRTTRDARFSTGGLIAAWRGRPPESFSTTWNGSLIALRAGTYSFAIASDGPSRLWIDRQPVVDVDAPRSARAAGSLALARGVHAIFVQYSHRGGPPDFQVLWGRGHDLEPLPSWALTPRSAGYVRFLSSVLLRRALPLAALLWIVTMTVVVAAVGIDSVQRARATGRRPSADACLIALGALVLFFVLPHDIQSDGRARYYALAELIEWGEVSAVPYSLIGPLFSAPLYFLGRVWMTSEWWCARFNAIVLVAGLVAAHRLMRGRVDPRIASTSLLLVVAASMFPYHVEGYFAEVFTAVLVGVGLLAVIVGHPVAGWTSAIVGVANTPATLAALAPASAWHAWQTRRLRHLLPIAGAAAAIMVESWLRRGSPFASGYAGNHGDATILTYSGRPGFSYPMFFGLLSVLFSFGKGIVFYAPGLILAVRDRFRDAGDTVLRVGGLWTVFLAGLIVIYSKWWAWYGGLFWGPRFFLFACFPASLALAVRVAHRDRARAASLAVALVVLTLSSWVAMDGVMFELSGLATCRDPAYEWLCLYVPEYSPLWRPFVELTRPTMNATIVGLYFFVVYVRVAFPLVGELAARSAITRPTLRLRRPAP